MNQYILLNKHTITAIEQVAKQTLEANKERPLSEASIEARAVLQLIGEIHRLNQFGDWNDDEKTPDIIAYETGWKDGYDEGLYDGMYK